MRFSKIETNYGKFPTLTHFERFWEDKVSQAFRDGFEKGKQIKGEKDDS